MENASQCLHALEDLFEESLRNSDFLGAAVWWREYVCALKMLKALELAPCVEFAERTDALLKRLLSAKYPEYGAKKPGGLGST